MASLTSAEYRALNAPKTPATGPKNALAPSPKGKTQPGEREAGTAPVFNASQAGPTTYLVGPYALSVGGRLHAEQLPDRLRIVVTGPASEALTAALVAALTQFVKT
jgi:hypothetical protein